MDSSPTLSLETIRHIAARQEIDVYVLVKLFKILTIHDRVQNAECIRLLGLPKTHFGRILKDLSQFLAPPSPHIALKEEYKSAVQSCIAQIHINETPQLSHEVRSIIQESIEKRPEPDRAYDQFYATGETVEKRAIHLFKNGHLLSKKILFLGDDDHTSLAVSPLLQDATVTVVDIDKRILGSIRHLSGLHQWNIQTIAHDLRHKLPVELLHSFDLVFTDPPYTSDGISLFLTRAIQAVKKAPTSRIFFCYGNSDRARERELQIQSIVTAHGLLIHEKLSGFNLYDGAESIGGRSSLYECALTPLTTVQSVQTQRMYTNFPQNDSREKILV